MATSAKAKPAISILLSLATLVFFSGTATASRTSEIVSDLSLPSGNVVRNHSVPYVHQKLDTPDSFNGNCACGPTSAVMALAFYQRLSPHSISISKGGAHTNDFGYYVSSPYSAFNTSFTWGALDDSNNWAYGAYGFTIQACSALWGKMAELFDKHYLAHDPVTSGMSNAERLAKIKQAIDSGYPVIQGTNLTSAGHVVLIRGYTDDDKLIVNDPNGNKYGGYTYGTRRDGENIQYSLSQMGIDSRNSMIVVKGVADADDNRSLSSGQTLAGSISPASDDDQYVFTGSAGSVIRLTMSKTSGALDSYLELYGPSSSLVARDDDSGGSLNSRIDVTLPSNGTYRVVAHSYNHASSGGYQIGLTSVIADGDDNRWLPFGGSLHGTIDSNSDRDTYYINGTANVVASIRMNRDAAPLDSYLELYNSSGTLVGSNDDSGGNNNAWLVYRFPSSGTYRLVARSFNFGSSGGYTLSASSVRGTNYALGRPVYYSSLDNANYLASYATDGNRSTRWSSGRSLNQWMWVDLGQTVSASQVVIRWEAARATNYGIYYYSNGNWVYLRSVGNGSGDVDVLSFSPVNTRYVMLSMWGRSSRYSNYSLYEFEVYDAIGALVPTVPPEDPGKPIETEVTPLTPLPPDPDGKDAPILALPSDQELEPLFDTTNVTPTVALSDTYGAPTTSLTLSGSILDVSTSIVVTATNAHDVDTGQIGSGIASYLWELWPLEPPENGSVADLLPDQASLSIAADGRPSGTYVLSLSVEDDEGNWSEPVTTTIQIWASLFLPAIGR